MSKFGDFQGPRYVRNLLMSSDGDDDEIDGYAYPSIPMKKRMGLEVTMNVSFIPTNQ